MGGITNLVLNALFPRTCVSCQQKGQLLCDRCGIAALGERPLWTTEHIALCWYARPAVRRLIDAWKFHGDLSAERWLGECIVLQAENIHKVMQARCTAPPVLIPAPLTRRRFAERGFNQAERLAALFGRHLNLPVQKHFVRRGHNIHLAQLTGSEERTAALATQEITLTGTVPANVILVDDVYTTGATATRLCHLLYAAGAERVITLTFAKS